MANGGIKVPAIASKNVPRGVTTKQDTTQASSLIKAASRVAIAPAEAAIKFQAERDETKAREAFNAFRSGSRNKVVELKQRRGSDAAGGTKEYQSWYEEDSKLAFDNLENGRQQEMFNQLANSRKDHDMDSLSVHEANEHQRFKESELQSTIITGRFDAASDPFNKDLLNSILADNRDRFESVYPGLDNSGNIARSDADIISAVILAQNEQDPAIAAKTLEERKAALGGAYEGLRAKIKKSELKQQSLQYTNVIVAREGDYDKQLKLARTIGNAELQDATVTRINARNMERQRVSAANNAAVTEGIASGIRQAPTLEAARDMATQGPLDKVATLTSLAEAVHGEPAIQTNYTKLAEAKLRVDNGEIANIEQLYLEYASSVSGPDMKGLESYKRQEGNKGDLKDTTVRRVFKTLTQKDPAKNESTAKAYDRTWNYVLQNLPPGTAPTDEVVGKLVSTALMEGEREGGGIGYGEDISYAEALEQGFGESWLPDVTSDEEDQIIPALKANNKSVTDKNIRLYKKHVILGVPNPVR